MSKSLEVIHPHAAGIDVGATAHYVAVAPDTAAVGAVPVRSFGCFTEDLDALVSHEHKKRDKKGLLFSQSSLISE